MTLAVDSETDRDADHVCPGFSFMRKTDLPADTESCLRISSGTRITTVHNS